MEGGWSVMWYKDDMHVVPKDDTRMHRLFGCWCNPTYDPDGRALSPVWIHHAADQREVKENAN